jgi:riboflavin synthase
MFTGLIEKVGSIASVSPYGEGKRLVVHVDDFWASVQLGDSISVDGVCSTVVERTDTTFTVDYLKETLKKTTVSNWASGQLVNIERCVTPTTHLGGHIVSGHVDTVGLVERFEKRGPWHEIEVSFSEDFAPLIVEKGSIALNGISLTLVDITETSFTCHLIPHTISHTSLQLIRSGGSVNLEFDIIGKYLYRFHQLGKSAKPDMGTLLSESGFKS